MNTYCHQLLKGILLAMECLDAWLKFDLNWTASQTKGSETLLISYFAPCSRDKDLFTM
jgi:hypothetical protein